MDQENKDATNSEDEEKGGPVEASAEDDAASENTMQHSDVDEKDGTPIEEGDKEHDLDQVDTDDAARRASLRTEALIQAAARDVVAEIEKTQDVPEEDESSRRESCASQIHHLHADGSDSGESSSQQDEEDEDEVDDEDDYDDEDDDDVFSDGSGRTSFGSMVDGSDRPASPKKTTDNDKTTMSLPRVSCVSAMSGLSSYEVGGDEDRPTVHTPCVPFRTPSSIRAMQMSSPTPSAGFSKFPTVSRLGSPAAKTTPRFKTPRKDLPLVLLHVTLLPLRWPWAELLNGLGPEVSEPLARLRDTWRALQDRVGDTVLERGVLLPHPQDDYEVLEERLLETLELPQLRRARILECGHYLGYSNMHDEMWSEDGREESCPAFLCRTCNEEIKYESLGAGRVIRVKVYASNGLMRAGAWAACWKEMERVDVELEPILEPNVQAELDALVTARREETQPPKGQEEDDEDAASTVVSPGPDEHMETSFVSHLASPSMLSEPIDTSEARRRRDAERMREIYGDETDGGSSMPASPSSTEPPSTEPSSTEPPSTEPPSTEPPSTEPPSTEPPSTFPPHHVDQEEEKQEYYQHHGQPAAATTYQSASLPELLWEAVKVLVRDPRNVAIVVLAVFLGFLALAPKTPSAVHHGYGLESVEAVRDVMVGVGENAPVEALVTSMSAVSAEAVELVDMSVETFVVHVQKTVTHTETQTQTQTQTSNVVVTATAEEGVATAEVEVVAMEIEVLAPVDEVDMLDETPTDVIHEADVETEVETDVVADVETDAVADVETDAETETTASGGTQEFEPEKEHLGLLAVLDLQALETPVHDEI